MDKYVKLEAIAKMAKPMEAIHKEEGYSKSGGKEGYAEGGKDWECGKCGTMVMATKEKPSMKCPCCGHEMDEYEDEESEDMEEGEDDGEYSS